VRWDGREAEYASELGQRRIVAAAAPAIFPTANFVILIATKLARSDGLVRM